jgi:serine protease inhibitor
MGQSYSNLTSGVVTTPVNLVFGSTDSTDMELSDKADYNVFAKKLYSRMSGNKVFSPLSLGTALNILQHATRGVTATELYNYLDVKYSINDMITTLSQFNLAGVKIANAIIINEDHIDDINDDYLAMMKPIALITVENFSNKRQICNTVNEYVATNTSGIIKDPIKEKMIDPNTVAYQINTVSFKAKWKKEFSKDFTDKHVDFVSYENFYVREQKPNATQIDLEVHMMYQSQRVPYLKNEKFQMIEMPYIGDEVVMGFVLLTDNKTNPLGMHQIILDGLDDNLSNMNELEVQIAIPKFKQRHTAINIKLDLIAGGVTSLFDPSTCNLSGMGTGIYVSDIIHETCVEVDEEGTTAVAVTIVDMKKESCARRGPEPIRFVADKSFMYYIRHKSTNTIMFIGDFHGKSSN